MRDWHSCRQLISICTQSIFVRCDITLTISDVNLKTEMFAEKIAYNFDMAFPFKKFSFPNPCRKENHWITPGIRTSCKRKRMLHEIGKITSDLNFKAYYNTYCKILKKKVIFEAKRMSNAEYILRSDNKNKAVWDAVNRETGRTKNKITNNRPTEIKIDEHNFTDLCIANIFNDYFSDVANKFLSSSPTPPTQKYRYLVTGLHIITNSVNNERQIKFKINLLPSNHG